MTQSHLTELSFSALHLPESLQKGLAEARFERCTPIQAQTLPKALAGIDIAGQAQTGTGKTIAFLVALYTKLLRDTSPADRNLTAPRALIMAPTRELAVQIHSDAEVLGLHTGLRLGLAFGGVDFEKQKNHLTQGVDILIGTPGRIIDFHKQRVIDLRFVQVVVLDEADRMFDLGFISDIRYILRRLPQPQQRLNLLFSATLSQRVLELAYEHMNDPQLVRIEPDKMTVERIRQVIYFPSMEEKPRLLVGLFKHMDPRRSMVFVNTRRGAEALEQLLQANGLVAAAISGDVPQHKRLRMLGEFHEGTLPILIGTDVASRGLHIPNVSHVFNYDLPQDPEDYVHRIGRTARAGTDGDAISFGCEEYVVSLPDIEAFIGRKIPVESIPPERLATLAPMTQRPTTRNRPPRRHQSRDQKHTHPQRSNQSATTATKPTHVKQTANTAAIQQPKQRHHRQRNQHHRKTHAQPHAAPAAARPTTTHAPRTNIFVRVGGYFKRLSSLLTRLRR